MRKILNKRSILFFLLLVWMMVIFFFSSQQGEDSSSLSSSFTYQLLSFIYPGFQSLDLTQQFDIVNTLQFFVRKSAHMTEYGILWILTYEYLRTYPFSKSRCFLYALVFCFGYACSDEWHQSFVPDRGPAFTDVLIDTCGSSFFGIFYSIAQRIFEKSKKGIRLFQ